MTDQEQKKVFAGNLNKYLSLYEKSQIEVANAIGVLPQTFNTWCQGKALPRMGKVQRLADYFKIKKSDLIDPPALSSPAAAPQRRLSDDEAALLSNYQKLNDTGKDKAREYVEDLTENEKYTEKELSSSAQNAG